MFHEISMILIEIEVTISTYYYLLLLELITTVDTLCKDGILIGRGATEALMSVWVLGWVMETFAMNDDWSGS